MIKLLKISMQWCIYSMVLLCLSGCLGSKKSVTSIRTFDDTYNFSRPDIANEEAFYQGGGIVVVPFVAGADVPANHAVNRAGLMVVKGVADGLKGSDHYVFLMPEDADLSDVIVEGTIDEWIESSKEKQARMSVTARMVDRYTDQLVMSVTFSKELPSNDKAFDDLAYEIGQDIALHLRLSERGGQ